MAAMAERPVAVSTWTFKQYPLLKALDAIHLLGVTDVELWAEGVHLDPRGNLPDLEEVGAALDRLGLWPTGMHAPFKGLDLTIADDGRRGANVAVIEHALDVAAALDCISVVLHVDGAGEEASGEERAVRLDRAADSLRRLCDYGLERGITLLIENQPDGTGQRIGARVDELIGLIETVDMPNLGLCFDLAHAIVSTGDWEGEWRRAQGHVASIHLSDTPGDADEHRALGDGGVDWSHWARTLGEFEADVDIVLEVVGGEEGVRTSLAELDRAVLAADEDT